MPSEAQIRNKRYAERHKREKVAPEAAPEATPKASPAGSGGGGEPMVITPLLLTSGILTLLYLWRRHTFDIVKPTPTMKLPQQVK